MASGLLDGVGVIMGSATGVGRCTAFAFAKSGVIKLVLADINDDALATTAEDILRDYPSSKIVPLHVDTSSEHSCITCVAEAVEAFGRIDYVLNNVGIGHSGKQDAAGLLTVLNVNLVGLWVSQKEQIKQMLKQEPLPHPTGRGSRGVITNTASVLGLVGGPAEISPYVASKHAIVGVTKAEAETYAKDGIRINSICPGYTSTAILGSGEIRSRIENMVLPRIPMGRLGRPEEIADCIVFLSSHMASYMSGATLVVDGGYTSI